MSDSTSPGTGAPLEVLVVGAGAVGQIYGDHLARGGARVTFYVRERYREATARGFSLVRLTGRRKRVARRFEGFAVVASPEEVAARRFDQVYLAVPSTGLVEPWLGELVAAIGEATLVNLAPGAGDRERVLAAGARSGLTAERLVDGFITIVSYHAPLPGEREVPEGMTVWYPPATPNLFSGPAQRTAQVVAALRGGGLPAKVARDVPRHSAFLGGAFMAVLLALEASGWSLARLRRERLAAAVAGARASLAVTARSFGAAPLVVRLALRAPLLRIATRIAPRVVPFPFEPYLRAHFTKVGAQTRQIIAAQIERGKAAGVAVTALETLLAAVPAEPGEPAAG
jgi:2-dehydropantoate 2-reductase